MPVHRNPLLIRPFPPEIIGAQLILGCMDVVLPAVSDTIGEALHFLRMSGTFYCRSEFTAPGGLALPPMRDCLMLHVVTMGECVLETEGTRPVSLQPGDLILVSHGRGHKIASAPGLAPSNLFEIPRE